MCPLADEAQKSEPPTVIVKYSVRQLEALVTDLSLKLTSVENRKVHSFDDIAKFIDYYEKI